LGSLFKHGKLNVKAKLPKTGYVAGESIRLVVEIGNESSKEVTKVQVELLRQSKFTADR
jgi:hypothetical protein